MVLLTHNKAPEVLKPGEEPFDVPSAFITAWQKSKLWPGAAGDGFAVQAGEELQAADVRPVA